MAMGLNYYTILLLAMMVSPSIRADQITDLVPLNTRSYGMGSAGVNSLNDSYAIFLNPANLSERRSKPRIELINMQAELSNYGVVAVGNQVSPLGLGYVYNFLKKNEGEWVGYRYSVYPNFTSRLVSFGVLYEQAFSSKYDGADPLILGSEPTVTYKGFRRVMPTAALSFSAMKGILKFGYSLGFDYLGVVNSKVTQPEGKSLSYTSGINEGTGIRNTAGMTVTLPFKHLPSFSLVARDIAKTKYFGGSLNKVTPMTFDAGFGHTTYFGGSAAVKITADWRDMQNKSQTNFMRRFFTGTEVVLGRSMSIRLGYGQGYPSAGIGFKVGKAKLDFAWYTQEMGDRLRDDPDQRFMFQMTWSLFNSK